MRLKNLEIKNFRNYPDLNLKITHDMVVFSGPNAVGKTNLLESVYFASLFKSFRDDAEFIFLRGTGAAEIKVVMEKGGAEHLLEVYLENRDKIYANFKIDGVRKKRKEAQGFMSVVIFEPSDVDMFARAPEVRRKYLNMVLSQKSPVYLDDIAQYKKIIGQKNRLLGDVQTGAAQPPLLDSWNDQLVEAGSRIIWERRQFINFLNQHVAEIYTAISGFHRPVEVFYQGSAGGSAAEIAEHLKAALGQYRAKELASGTSLVGPHRDDFFLQSDGVYLSPFSSRGELRSQILALKILELEYLSRDGEKPILLLDDVLSELDETRRTFLLKYLSGKFQTLITTTSPLEMSGQHVTLTPSVQEEGFGL